MQGARQGATLWDYPHKHLVVIRDEKVSPFVKFQIILLILCFFLDTLTNKQDIEFCDKFKEKFQDLSKVKNHAVNKVKV